ncbi:hypothetical protein B0T22DRAFT_244529 [Podospora appendiculata]|uniref:Uncharacterized protein n=1 Tax=Podospora appendiculata TaxID=314037 RepID=A0AAE0X216_9PEZI|nr:hypothetical protein B0T22DRAFT_244529 [Podospora appendiculata]
MTRSPFIPKYLIFWGFLFRFPSPGRPPPAHAFPTPAFKNSNHTTSHMSICPRWVYPAGLSRPCTPKRNGFASKKKTRPISSSPQRSAKEIPFRELISFYIFRPSSTRTEQSRTALLSSPTRQRPKNPPLDISLATESRQPIEFTFFASIMPLNTTKRSILPSSSAQANATGRNLIPPTQPPNHQGVLLTNTHQDP